MAVNGVLQLLFRETLKTGVLQRLAESTRESEAGFDPVQVNPRAFRCEFGDEPQVVGMKMGDKEIRRVEIYVQAVKSGAHDVHALLSSHPRIDDEASVPPLHDVRIDGLEGISGKGYLDSVDVFYDLFRYGSLTWIGSLSLPKPRSHSDPPDHKLNKVGDVKS
jgi:hypothetical protein